jgi:hypothetical protein
MYGPSIEENFRWFAKLDFSYILCVLNVAWVTEKDFWEWAILFVFSNIN